MKKMYLLLCVVLLSTFSFAKNPVNVYKDLKSGKKDEALKSFLEIKKKDSVSLIANYSLALLYSDSNFSQYDLELSYKYSKKANEYVDYDSNHNLHQWKELIHKNKLNDAEKLKIEPYRIYRLNDSILSAIFLRASAKNSIIAYENFIKDYPEYHDINFVRDLINDIAFKEAKNKNTIEAFDYFIDNYKNSSKIFEAKQKKIQLKTELAFNQAKGKNTIEAYEQFVVKYPECAQYVQLANEQIQELSKTIITSTYLKAEEGFFELGMNIELAQDKDFKEIKKLGKVKEALDILNNLIDVVKDVNVTSYYNITNNNNGVDISLVDTSMVNSDDKISTLSHPYNSIYSRRARLNYYLGDYDKSIDDYTVLTNFKLDKGIFGYYNRGFVNMTIGEYNKAIVDFNKVIEIYRIFNLDQTRNLKGLTKYVYASLGYIEYRKGNLEKSLEYLNLAVMTETGENFDRALINRAVVRLKLGDEIGCVRDYELFVNTINNIEQLSYCTALYNSTSYYPTTIDFNEFIFAKTCVNLFKRNYQNKGSQFLDYAIEISPNNAEAHLLRGEMKFDTLKKNGRINSDLSFIFKDEVYPDLLKAKKLSSNTVIKHEILDYLYGAAKSLNNRGWGGEKCLEMARSLGNR